MNLHSQKVLSLKVQGFLSNIPTPSSISYFWNFGSLLGVCLLVQILSGFFLTFHYHPSLNEAFESVSLLEEVELGWFIRFVHANGASFFFIFVYLHIARGLYYSSYNFSLTWSVGVIILFLLIGAAFLGYVLPWGQMSFWGATVITNLLSSLPKGVELVEWVWGGFSVGGPTLSRFFSLHYILPFGIVVLVLAHLVFLHESGSSNPLGVSYDSDKIFFHPFFSYNDLVGFIGFFSVLLFVVFLNPFLWIDPDNFTPANPMVTPVHIQPEWYFLFAYAILRSIPNNLGGVIALVLSVASLLLLPILSSGNGGSRFSYANKLIFWSFSMTFVFLTFLGSLPAEGVYVLLGQFIGVLYFVFLFLLPL